VIQYAFADSVKYITSTALDTVKVYLARVYICTAIIILANQLDKLASTMTNAANTEAIRAIAEMPSGSRSQQTA
jgi:hypothetical protein